MKNDLKVSIFWQKPASIKFNQNSIEKEIFKLLQKHKLSGIIELSISFISSNRIKLLNNCYRQINLATDVLSFPANQKISKKLPINNLGDIYISQNFVNKNLPKYHSDWQKYPQSKKEGIIENEWQFLIMHGLKHLIGVHHK